MTDWTPPERVWIWIWHSPPLWGSDHRDAYDDRTDEDDHEYVPEAERVHALRDALAEVAREYARPDLTAEQKLDLIGAILSNGPLDTAPGGPREDECWRLREENERLRERNIALGEAIHDEMTRPIEHREGMPAEWIAPLDVLPEEPHVRADATLRARVEELEAELADERADRKAFHKHYVEAEADADALRGEHHV